MIIKKILNNNAIVTYDEKGNDVIVFGKGISFHKKVGERIDQKLVDQRFVLENKSTTSKLEELIQLIPYEQVKVCNEIVEMINKNYSKQLHENFYLSLIDHISFAIERKEKGLMMQNPLTWEIRKFYPEEYRLGIQAIEILKERFGICFDENEIATIAMHISDASIGDENMMITKILDIVETSLRIVKYTLAIDFDEESLSYYRFVTHLKYFAQRIILNSRPTSSHNPLESIIKVQFEEAYACALKIQAMLKERYAYETSQDEIVYLSIHINRVLHDAK